MMKGIALWGYRFLMALNEVDGDPMAQRVWRRSIAAVATVTLLGLAFLALWLLGYVPGLSGAAWARDIDTMRQARNVQISQMRDAFDRRITGLERKQDATTLLIVKGAVRQALIDRCTAISHTNQEALQAANDTLDSLSDQYLTLTGRMPVMPDCSVVLIHNNNASP